MITKKLNRKQTKWTKFLANFNLIILYQVEKIHAKIDFLTRKSKDKSISKNEDRQKHQMQTILISNRLDKRFHAIVKNVDESKITIIAKSVSIETDELEREKKMLILFFKIFVFKKKKLDLIKKMHDQSIVDHFDIWRIVQMMQRFFE